MHTHKSYKYCPLCGTELQTGVQMGEARLVCPACGWAHYEDPKVAAGVVLTREDQVLLVRRTMEPYQNTWSIPAGFVNAYEDPRDAAKRECLEETGLSVEVEGLFEILTGREHPRGADIFLAYRARLLGGTLKAADDADLADWFGLDELPPLAFVTTKKVIARLKAGKTRPD